MQRRASSGRPVRSAAARAPAAAAPADDTEALDRCRVTYARGPRGWLVGLLWDRRATEMLSPESARDLALMVDTLCDVPAASTVSRRLRTAAAVADGLNRAAAIASARREDA